MKLWNFSFWVNCFFNNNTYGSLQPPGINTVRSSKYEWNLLTLDSVGDLNTSEASHAVKPTPVSVGIFGSSGLEADPLLMVPSMILQRLDFQSSWSTASSETLPWCRRNLNSESFLFNMVLTLFSVVACRYLECGQLECDVIPSINSDFRAKWNAQ